jgi:hypothetical protein
MDNEEETKHFHVRSVDTITLDGIRAKAASEGQSIEKFARDFLDYHFYEVGLKYRKALKEVNSH